MGNSENWVSFVDLLIISSIVLCLIISISKYSESKIRIELPRMVEKGGTGFNQIQTISISMKKESESNHYYLEDEVLRKNQLSSKLRVIRPKAVMLRADKNIAYEDILDLIRLLRETGVTSLSFGYVGGQKP